MCAKVSKLAGTAKRMMKKTAATPTAATPTTATSKRSAVGKSTGHGTRTVQSPPDEESSDDDDQAESDAENQEESDDEQSGDENESGDAESGEDGSDATNYDDVPEDFLHYRMSAGSNDTSTDDTPPRRSLSRTPRRSMSQTPRRSVTQTPQRPTPNSPRGRSVVGRRSSPQRPSKSTARKSAGTTPAAGPSHASPQRRPRKQAKPKRKARVIKHMVQLQKTTNLLIPLASFQRVVREVFMNYGDDIRVQTLALRALQEATEAYLVNLFEDSVMCMLHRNRVTLTDKDLRLLLKLRPSYDPGKH